VSGDLRRRWGSAIAWLLTPVVAWAASFLGAWLGAIVGRRAAGGIAGLWWLAGGAAAGAVIGLLGWALLLARLSRVIRGPDPTGGSERGAEGP